MVRLSTGIIYGFLLLVATSCHSVTREAFNDNIEHVKQGFLHVQIQPKINKGYIILFVKVINTSDCPVFLEKSPDPIVQLIKYTIFYSKLMQEVGQPYQKTEIFPVKGGLHPCVKKEFVLLMPEKGESSGRHQETFSIPLVTIKELVNNIKETGSPIERIEASVCIIGQYFDTSNAQGGWLNLTEHYVINKEFLGKISQ